MGHIRGMEDALITNENKRKYVENNCGGRGREGERGKKGGKDYINVKLKEEAMGSNKLYTIEKEEGRQEIMYRKYR
jgi:hypothetical protein